MLPKDGGELHRIPSLDSSTVLGFFLTCFSTLTYLYSCYEAVHESDLWLGGSPWIVTTPRECVDLKPSAPGNQSPPDPRSSG